MTTYAQDHSSDYTSEMLPKSTSLNAARSADAAAAAAATPTLTVSDLSSEHAIQMAESLSERANGYSARHGGRASSGVFAQLMAEAAHYELDASTIQLASAEYARLVPHSQQVNVSTTRFSELQAQLGMEGLATKNELTAELGAGGPQLAAALSSGDIKTSKGRVTDAAKSYSTAEGRLLTSLTELHGLAMRRSVAALTTKIGEKAEEKERIERAIEAAENISSIAGSMLGFAESATVGPAKVHEHDEIARKEGGFEVADVGIEIVGEAGGAIAFAMHARELAEVSAKLGVLTSQLNAIKLEKEATEVAAIEGRYAANMKACGDAANAYANALESQRTAYAKAGATADRSRTKQDPDRGHDDSSQVMLFVSAARETNVILGVALEAASKGGFQLPDLHTALKQMDSHRQKGYDSDEFETTAGEGNSAPDRELVFEAFSRAYSWVEATRKDKEVFAAIEDQAAQMLDEVGHAAGEY